MKTHSVTTLAAVLVSLTMASPAPGQQDKLTAGQKSQQLYKQGMAAEEAGQAAAAKEAYQEALRLHPGNANARYRLGMLKSNYDQVSAKGRQANLDSIIIPEYKVNDVLFPEALKALGLHIEKATNNEQLPNFIIQDTGGKLSTSSITLTLKKVPAGTILNYLLEMSGGKARFDEHAVVITPR